MNVINTTTIFLPLRKSWGGYRTLCFFWTVESKSQRTSVRVAEVGSISARAKMAIKIFVKRVFTIFATNASFLPVTADLQIQFSIICNKYHVIMHFLPKKRCYCPKKALFCLKSSKKSIVRKSQQIFSSRQNT